MAPNFSSDRRSPAVKSLGSTCHDSTHLSWIQHLTSRSERPRIAVTLFPARHTDRCRCRELLDWSGCHGSCRSRGPCPRIRLSATTLLSAFCHQLGSLPSDHTNRILPAMSSLSSQAQSRVNELCTDPAARSISPTFVRPSQSGFVKHSERRFHFLQGTTDGSTD